MVLNGNYAIKTGALNATRLLNPEIAVAMMLAGVGQITGHE